MTGVFVCLFFAKDTLLRTEEQQTTEDELKCFRHECSLMNRTVPPTSHPTSLQKANVTGESQHVGMFSALTAN